MANLAIRGHETRGKEVIEILEMLGGKNIYDRSGEIDIWYILASDNVITAIYLYNEKGFTLEEFLEKFPYKVGDFVSIPEYESEVRIYKMRWSNFGYVEYLVYRCDDEEWYTAEVLNEYNDPHKEETMKETNKTIFEGNAHCCDIMNNIIKDNIKERKYAEYYFKVWGETEKGLEVFVNDDFELKEDNGKFYLVKKKPLFPKTYKDCCEVLMGKTDFQDYSLVLTKLSTNKNEENSISPEPPHITLINNYYKLLICRDAYWKVYGEEMGLGKPWKPENPTKHYIFTIENNGSDIIKNAITDKWRNRFLVFPTEEMRDAFYENFKELIEACKELL